NDPSVDVDSPPARYGAIAEAGGIPAGDAAAERRTFPPITPKRRRIGAIRSSAVSDGRRIPPPGSRKCRRSTTPVARIRQLWRPSAHTTGSPLLPLTPDVFSAGRGEGRGPRSSKPITRRGIAGSGKP